MQADRLEGIYHEQIGTGIPILCLHGFTLNHYSLKNALEPIFETSSSWCRHYIDLPGMGQSHPKNKVLTSDDMLGVLLAYIDIYIPTGSFVLCGHSYGGYLARAVAHLMPERIKGMLLIAPVIDPLERRTALRHFSCSDTEYLTTIEPDLLKQMKEQLGVISKTTAKRYRDEVWDAQAMKDDESLKELRENGYLLTITIDDSTIPSYPIHAILGEYDSVVGVQDTIDILQQWPAATWSVVQGTGHYPQLEKRENFISESRKLIYKVENIFKHEL